MPLALGVSSLLIAGLSVLAVRSRPMRGPWWVPAMAASELAPVFLAASSMLAVGHLIVWDGSPPGVVGGLAAGLAVVLFGVGTARHRLARSPIEAAVSAVAGERVALPPTSFRGTFRPYPSLPGPFELRTLAYGPHDRHRVDRIADAGVRSGPVLIHVHGGGWWRGRRSRQARPLIHRMAAQGWVVLAPSYRLSPEATFPDHLDDIERLIRWVRERASEIGADPSFVAVAGGSAGGQLAALAGLRDPSLGLVVPIYGVHDLLADDGETPKWPYLRSAVMKSNPETDPAAWAQASPIRSATAHRAAFLIVHGASDWVVRPEESRRLSDALQATGGPPVGFAEVPHAHHGFDFFASARSAIVAEGIAAALGARYAAHRAG